LAKDPNQLNDDQDQVVWTAVFRADAGRFEVGLSQLWEYRDLILLLIRRDIASAYKQTILGPLWFLIQPLVTTLMFVVVFGQVAGLSTDGQPQVLFYMLGTISWSYFASCFIQTASTFTVNAGLFGKVYFPRLAVPLAGVFSNLVTLTIQLGLFVVVAGILTLRGYVPTPTIGILGVPLLIAMIAGLALGLGLSISALTARYRDLQHVVTFFTPLLMYATPIIYPLSSVPNRLRWFASANPMTPIIEALRVGVLGSGTVSAWTLLYSVAVIAALLLLGIVLFNRAERTFMDTV
jgi:lipopolysaccharide transport system permease protein